MQISAMNLLHLLLLSAASLLSSEGTDFKIINGHEVKRNSRPYMAYILISNGTHTMSCGGTLIKFNWVLTAGHCTLPYGKAQAVLGAHLSGLSAKENGRQIFSVVKYIPHPKYNSATLYNDLQLMKLSHAAKIGRGVQSLSLPRTYEDVQEGKVCETAGWGWTEKKKSAKYLMEVKVKSINRRECEKRLNKEKLGKISDKMTCTAVGPGGEDTCNGDSGGPLICGGVFRGVVSYGNMDCGKPNGAAVYTRLTEKYVDWIDKMTV
ncbi:hypothetical protein GDO81_002799 [Engystomops pustulosus]|nr:hypothetical protein GDO81_002799 [Engystomops pustulosus]